MILGIFKNKITRNAIIYTLVALFVYRIGSYIVTPGIDPSLALGSSASKTGLAAIFDLFGGGSIGRLSLFALGVSPYVSASIIIQLLETELIPAFGRWKHQGVEGQNKRSMWTKYLTIVLAFAQAIVIPLSYSMYLDASFVSYISIAVFMTAGTACMMWIADRITEKGIGNGMSVVIMAGILAAFPQQISLIVTAIKTASTANDGSARTILLAALSVLVLLLILIILVIYFTLAYRKISVNYVRSGKGTLRKNSYIPVKLNPAGVIPVIFVSPLFILFQWLGTQVVSWDPGKIFSNDGGSGYWELLVQNMFNLTVTQAAVTNTVTKEVYNSIIFVPFVLYFVIIVLFSVFYSYIQMNPENMAENLGKQSAYVVGIRPGEDTISYVTKVIIRVSVWGGLMLAFIATLPQVLQYVFTTLSITSVSAAVIGTGLIITVSVLVQTHKSLINKIESKKYRRLLGDIK